jgi:hypothetical protein
MIGWLPSSALIARMTSTERELCPSPWPEM